MSNDLILRSGEETAELTPQDYVAILRRRKPEVLNVAMTVALCALIYACVAPKTYQATSEILVDAPSLTVSNVDANDPLSSLFNLGQQQAVDTQVQELQTQPLLAQTARQAGKAKIEVNQVDTTNIIQVSAQSHSPLIAANAANTLVELYMNQNLDNDQRDMVSAVNFAQSQLGQSQKAADASESRLLDFQRTHNVTDLDKEMEYIQTQFGTLRSELQTTQSDLAANRAAATSLLQQLASEPENTQSQLVATNPNLAVMKAQLLQDQIQKQRMTQPGGYTDRAPQVRAINGEIAALQHKLASEPQTVTTVSSAHNAVYDDIKNQVTTAQAQAGADNAKITAINAQVAGLKDKLQALAADEGPYQQLVREHQEDVGADAFFQQKITDLDLRLQARHSSEHVIQNALIPTVPIYPNRPLIVIFGVALGIFLGLLCALGMEYFDDRMNSPEDGERALGLVALGRIPIYTTEDLQMLTKMKGRRPEMESYKTFRTNLYFCSVDRPVKTLLLTSACPNEGKTTTSIHLALAVAADHKDVILVDTDLRLPSIHSSLGLPQSPGLTDVLVGKTSLERVMHSVSGIPNLKVIPAGTLPPNPSELLNSRRFNDILVDLSRMADMVICDGSPVLPVADSQIVSSMVDATVLVVSNGETRKTEAVQARKLLDRARANIVGIAYNKAASDEPTYYRYSHPEPELIETSMNGHIPSLTSSEAGTK